MSARQLHLGGATIIAALHLPPLPGTPKNTMNIDGIVQFAVENARVFAANGVDALYLQDSGHGIGPKRTPTNTVAALAVAARAVRDAVAIPVGVLSAGYDAEGPLAAAAAAGADFIRLKVYVGAMMKPEGIVEGCADEAQLVRQRLGIAHVRILADIYDRTGVPLSPDTLENAAQWAATYGGADALILTGRRVEESIEMVDHVRQHGIAAPLFCAGGAAVENVGRLLAHCDGIIVSTSLKAHPPNPHLPWDPGRISAFMAAVRAARQAAAVASAPHDRLP